MTTLRKASVAASLAAAMALAGCMSGGGMGGGPMAPRPTGVEGSWIDGQRTGMSTFAGGVFSTVATDTGQKLSEGSYIVSNGTSVQINGTSLIRQTPISFNCLLVTPAQLNCTSSGGQQFILTRYTA
ncbi:MAG TPA: hypothetical protein VMF90_21695 [Rhizobiaceae bacterium]|nr:hypothetical protein [Rhizobiaceae bacterium]